MIIKTKFTDQDLQHENVLQEIKEEALKQGINDFYICYNSPLYDCDLQYHCLDKNYKIIEINKKPGIFYPSSYARTICLSKNGNPIVKEEIVNLLCNKNQEACKININEIFILSIDDEFLNNIDH